MTVASSLFEARIISLLPLALQAVGADGQADGLLTRLIGASCLAVSDQVAAAAEDGGG